MGFIIKISCTYTAYFDHTLSRYIVLTLLSFPQVICASGLSYDTQCVIFVFMSLVSSDYHFCLQLYSFSWKEYHFVSLYVWVVLCYVCVRDFLFKPISLLKCPQLVLYLDCCQPCCNQQEYACVYFGCWHWFLWSYTHE